MRNRTQILITLVLVLATGPFSGSVAATIDDFSTPQGPLSGVPGAVSDSAIIGGVREFDSGNTFEAVSGVGTFSSADGTGNIMGLIYDGTAALGDDGEFAPVDLTDGGLATLFLLSVSGYQAPLGSSVLLAVSDVNNVSLAAAIFPFNAAGLYTAAIPTNLVDFTQINQVSLTVFLGASPPTGGSISIDFVCTGNEAGCTTGDSVTAVPEPGTAVLLALGGGVLALLRRRRAGKHARP